MRARKPPKQIYVERQLSRRDNQVLQLLGVGLTNEQIANRLGIGVGTLQNYFGHLRDLLRMPQLKNVRRLAHEWTYGKVEIYVKIKCERIGN